MSNSLVSVLVPCFNHAKYIETCILSVINQSYKNIELIVLDDGSTDGSYEIAEQLKLKFDFKLIKQDNRGLAATLNRAIIEFSNGDYVAICASDDYFPINKIEKQVGFMQLNPKYMMKS